MSPTKPLAFGIASLYEPRMQIMAGHLLESKHNLLQARVEHLELDLGFKAPEETGWWRCVFESYTVIPYTSVCSVYLNRNMWWQLICLKRAVPDVYPVFGRPVDGKQHASYVSQEVTRINHGPGQNHDSTVATRLTDLTYPNMKDMTRKTWQGHHRRFMVLDCSPVVRIIR